MSAFKWDMFGFFKSAASKFTTQEDMLTRLNADKQHGLCSPLANLYAESEMGIRSRHFLETDPQETYDIAKKMEQHQDEVAHQFEEPNGTIVSLNVAFYDAGKSFKAVIGQSVDELSNPEGFKSVVKNSEHVLLDYPTKPVPGSKDGYHQVYYGHTAGTNACSYFNANNFGGATKGTCDQVISMITQDIKNTAAHDGRNCLVARSDSPPTAKASDDEFNYTRW